MVYEIYEQGQRGVIVDAYSREDAIQAARDYYEGLVSDDDYGTGIHEFALSIVSEDTTEDYTMEIVKGRFYDAGNLGQRAFI